VLGSFTTSSFGDLKLNAEIRSPVTARRHLVMLLSIRSWLPPANRRSPQTFLALAFPDHARTHHAYANAVRRVPRVGHRRKTIFGVDCELNIGSA
jgi:hypothetical protein